MLCQLAVPTSRCQIETRRTDPTVITGRLRSSLLLHLVLKLLELELSAALPATAQFLLQEFV
jgi:hypothetical protein